MFSVEAIEDHSTERLRTRIAEPTDSDWRFYFNEKPSQAVLQDFLAELGEQRAFS